MPIITRRLTTPIRSKPGDYYPSRFRLPPGAMLDALEDELRQLRVDDAVLYVDTAQRNISRVTGMVNVNSSFDSVGVAVVFEHPKHGELRFECTRYDKAMHNVYAIARTMWALRRVDDWGATHGEQFAGFARIPARTGATMTSTTAAEILSKYGVGPSSSPVEILTQPNVAKDAIRRAKAATHPDGNGSAVSSNAYATIGVAEQIIRTHHGGKIG